MNREKTLLTQMGITIGMIVICLAAMGFSAFAYFSHSISSGMNVIQSAHFDVIVTDMDEQSGVVLAGNRLENSKAKKYQFKIQSDGNAETGYCKIVISQGGVNRTFYTTQLFQTAGEDNRLTELTLEINVSEGCTIEFIPQWGTSSYYAVDQEKLYGHDTNKHIDFLATPVDDDEIGGDESDAENGTNDMLQPNDSTLQGENVILYTVVSEDTLWGIAQQYNVRWEDIAAYNQIEDARNIIPGQVLKIPVSGEVSESESASNEPTETTSESAKNSGEAAQ